MNGWAWLIVVIALFYAYSANEQAEQAHGLARDALYEAQSAKTRVSELESLIEDR